MKVLGILQNSWFYDPPKIKRMLAQYATDPERQERLRRKLMTYALFAGCKSGRMLQQALGEAWCNAIVWENASKEIGDLSSSCFPADLPHLRKRIQEEAPDVLVTFGKVATNACMELEHLAAHRLVDYFIAGPHPTARDPEVACCLYEVRKRLDKLKDSYEHTD